LIKNEYLSVAIVAVAAVAAMLFATSLVGTNAVFAGGYEKNQATSQANDCGNGKLPLNVGCQNVGSQIQGDENSVAIAADQAFDD
jgi:hypothetical protein